MKLKLLIILLTLTTLTHYKSFGQATPVSPVPSTTNSAYYEPSTKRIWNYYGNYGWRTFVDSLRLYKILNSYQVKLGYVPVNLGGDVMKGALASNQSVGSILDQTNRSRTFQVLSPFGNDPAFSLEMNYGNISLGEVALVWRYGMHYPDFNFYRTRYDESGQANQSYMFYDTYNLKFGTGLSYTRDSLTKVWTLNAQSPDLSGYAKLNGGNTFNGTQQFSGLVNIHTLTFGTVGQINDVVPNLDFSHLHYDDGNGLVVDGGVPFVLTNATGSFKFRPIGNSLYLTDPAITMGMYFQGNDLYDINGKKVLKTGDAPTTADLNDYVKRTVGVIHLTDVPTMMAYTGPATTVIVDAPNSGGTFVYTPNIVVTNYYNRLAATGKGTGAWVRQADMSKGVNILWDYRIKADAIYNPYSYTITNAYTDNAPYIDQMIRSVARGAIKILVPKTQPYYLGCASPILLRQGTHFEGVSAFFPLQIITGADSTRFSFQSGFAFASSDGFKIAQDSAYRMQGVGAKNISINGPLKSVGNYNGISLPSNPMFNNSAPGVSDWENVFIYGFRTSFDFMKGNDPHLLRVFAQYSQVCYRNGASAIKMQYSNAFRSDTVAILKGNESAFDNNAFNNCNYGIYCDSLYDSNFGSGNQFFKINYDFLTFRTASAYNTISGHFEIAPQHAITFYKAGDNNQVINAVIDYTASDAIYATGTNKLSITSNVIGNPTSSTKYAIRADTCQSLNLAFNKAEDYAYNYKVGGTGSTLSVPELATSMRIRQKTDWGGTSEPSYIATNLGSGLGSFLPTSTATATSKFSTWSGSGDYNGVKVGGYTIEQQSATTAGQDLGIWTTAPGTATQTLAAQIGTQGLRLLLNGRGQGDILYNSATGYYTRLGIGSTNQILTVVGGFPAWVTPAFAPINNASLTGTTSFIHLKGNSTAPTVAAGVGAGTGGTATITGSDAAGEITITTGTAPTAAALVATITFNTAYTTAPYIVLQKSSVTTPTDMEIGTRATTSFTITGTLAASTTYKYNYIIVQ